MHNLQVKDLMTKKPHCIKADETVLIAARIMIEKGFSHLIVKNEAGSVVGMLSDRDLIKASKISADKKVSEFMNWPVYTISANASVRFALEEMMLQKVSALVVEDKSGDLCGIVTTDDFLIQLLDDMRNDDNSHA